MPALKPFAAVFYNKEKIENNVSLNVDDEIALLPPFAGG